MGCLSCLGVGLDDTVENARRLAAKTVKMRIFSDLGGKMNLSLRDVGGERSSVSASLRYWQILVRGIDRHLSMRLKGSWQRVCILISATVWRPRAYRLNRVFSGLT